MKKGGGGGREEGERPPGLANNQMYNSTVNSLTPVVTDVADGGAAVIKLKEHPAHDNINTHSTTTPISYGYEHFKTRAATIQK